MARVAGMNKSKDVGEQRHVDCHMLCVGLSVALFMLSFCHSLPMAVLPLRVLYVLLQL